MSDQIIPIDTIRARARRDFDAGRARDQHNMNWDAAALPTWLAEWDRCAQAAELEREVESA